MTSPSSASFTCTAESESSRFARDFVKPGGMCCTTTTPQGRSFGRRVMTLCSACGPPVEVPIATSFCPPPAGAFRSMCGWKTVWRGLRSGFSCFLRRGFSRAGALSPPTCGSTVRRNVGGAFLSLSFAASSAARALAMACFTFALAAARHCSRMSPSIVSMREIEPPALLMKSTAPSESARIVSSVPSFVRLESMTTGIGWTSMMTASALSPSITGICTSIVRRSGFSCLTFSMASRPLTAVPTTSKSGCDRKRSDRTFRMNAESSAIRIRIILLTP